ncbi:hypothetical protein B0H17DRAFT_1142576 [Mycena rosella]|uniref:Uncharacterized protein n=1 Tax=Mycena rosella TaxID=1033263 RepID=A0AAD7CWV1_MYCRO|nr:hypothetical protein B0H17DRAFT_1142576 [Mycena rosella]
MTELSQLRLALEPRFIFSDSASKCPVQAPCPMDNVVHIMQADTLNQLVINELDPSNIGTGLYVLAVVLNRRQTDVSELKVGDLVRVQVFLYRRDGYEHQTLVKVSSNGTRCRTMRAETTVVLSQLETQEISGCCVA